MGKRERSQTITMNKKEDKNDLRRRKAYISSHFYINVKLGTPENTQL